MELRPAITEAVTGCHEGFSGPSRINGRSSRSGWVSTIQLRLYHTFPSRCHTPFARDIITLFRYCISLLSISRPVPSLLSPSPGVTFLSLLCHLAWVVSPVSPHLQLPSCVTCPGRVTCVTSPPAALLCHLPRLCHLCHLASNCPSCVTCPGRVTCVTSPPTSPPVSPAQVVSPVSPRFQLPLLCHLAWVVSPPGQLYLIATAHSSAEPGDLDSTVAGVFDPRWEAPFDPGSGTCRPQGAGETLPSPDRPLRCPPLPDLLTGPAADCG